MFKEGDWVTPADNMLRISGIDVENIQDMRVTKVFSSAKEIECFMRITNGQSLRATFVEGYVVPTSEEDGYSLTF